MSASTLKFMLSIHGFCSGKILLPAFVHGALCLAVIGGFLGCASDENGFARTQHYRLMSGSGKFLVVRSIRLIPDGDRPLLTGRVESFAPEEVTEYEHLVISVFGPDSKLLARLNTNYNPRGIPINPRNPFHYATYAERLPLVPPAGSTIRVAVAWD